MVLCHWSIPVCVVRCCAPLCLCEQYMRLIQRKPLLTIARRSKSIVHVHSAVEKAFLLSAQESPTSSAEGWLLPKCGANCTERCTWRSPLIRSPTPSGWPPQTQSAVLTTNPIVYNHRAARFYQYTCNISVDGILAWTEHLDKAHTKVKATGLRVHCKNVCRIHIVKPCLIQKIITNKSQQAKQGWNWLSNA